jgi:hypothetical protein
MTCISCYACLIKEPYLPTILGKKNESIGNCINCHAFACGHHGFRDRGSRRFECIMCYPSLLASSAGAVASLTNQNLNKQVMYELIIQHYPRRFSTIDLEFPYITSMVEFYERYPFYEELLNQELSRTRIDWNSINNQETQNTLKSFPPKAKEMLQAAGILINLKDEETKPYYPIILIQIAEAIKPQNDGGGFYGRYS